MSEWPWIERTFDFNFPPQKFPEIIERLRGTPGRVAALVAGQRPEVLTTTKGPGWTVQQNIGHLIDLGYLPRERIAQILAGADTLIAADMTNGKTHETDHNGRPIAELLDALRRERQALVTKLEAIDPRDWGRSALHPRLQTPMRIVDVAFFDAEHDDYHIARIRQLIKQLG